MMGQANLSEQLSDLFFMEFVIGLDKHFKKRVDNIVDYIPLIDLPDEYSANLFRQVNSAPMSKAVEDISAFECKQVNSVL